MSDYKRLSRMQHLASLRWRALPGWLFLIFGWTLAFGNAVFFGVWILLIVLEHAQFSAKPAIGLFLSGCAGSLWIVAGRAFFVRSWKRAIFAVVLGYFLGVAGSYLASPDQKRPFENFRISATRGIGFSTFSDPVTDQKVGRC